MCEYNYSIMITMGLFELNADSAGFTYRLGRLKPRVSHSRGALAKVSNILTLS
jgi:hypothetical protein